MSTKGMVSFLAADGTTVAAVYLHNAGHDVEAELKRFLGAVAEAVAVETPVEVRRTRFHDPSYLAARYIVWREGGEILVQSIGVIIPGQVHVNREFNVFCHAEPTLTLPDVTEAWR